MYFNVRFNQIYWRQIILWQESTIILFWPLKMKIKGEDITQHLPSVCKGLGSISEPQIKE